jgi:hypothetical protein
MNGTLALILVLMALLAGAVAVAWWGWSQLADVAIGIHGWIALGLGVTVTLLLGGGLMWLVFYSNRHGYDDAAGRD